MALRVDSWKMHIGVKKEGSWWNEKYYPSVPYLFNLAMDPLEKMDQESHEWGSAGRQFFAHKMWALNASGPFIAAHLKSLMEYPPSQGADTLSIKKALEEMQAKMEKAAPAAPASDAKRRNTMGTTIRELGVALVLGASVAAAGCAMQMKKEEKAAKDRARQLRHRGRRHPGAAGREGARRGAHRDGRHDDLSGQRGRRAPHGHRGDEVPGRHRRVQPGARRQDRRDQEHVRRVSGGAR